MLYEQKSTTIPSYINQPWKCSLKLVSVIFHYFLKTNVFLRYFERSTLKRNLTYSCFFFPLFHEHLFSPGLPRATRLLETSCLEKITVCVIEIMLVTLLLVQMNKARREVNRTKRSQPNKPSTNQYEHRERPSNFCYTLNPWEHMSLNIESMRYFLKNIFWSKHFPATTNYRSRHSRVFLVKPVLKIS